VNARRLLAATSVALLATSLSAGAVPSRRLTPMDLTKNVGVGAPAISPDGKTIAVLISRSDFAQDKHTSELDLIDIASGTSRMLSMRPTVAQPTWSPSGDRLAFLAAEDESKKDNPQIYVLPMNGGDARPITSAKDGVQQFAFRPDGRAFAYVTNDPDPDKKKKKDHRDGFEVGNNDFLARDQSTNSHIWMVAADGKNNHRLTSGNWTVQASAPPGPPSSPLSFSADGKSLLYTRQASPNNGDSDKITVWMLDVASHKSRKLTTHTIQEAFAQYSPDGQHVAYLYSRDGDPNNLNDVMVTGATGGAGSDLTKASIDRNAFRVLWMPDSKHFLTSGHDKTTTAYYVVDLAGGAKKLSLGDVTPSSFFWMDASIGKSGAIAFPGSTPTHPAELYYLASVGATPRQLTHFNDRIPQTFALGRNETIEWNGPNGFREDGVLTYPPGYNSARAYPLVLYVHGGPQYASERSFGSFPQLIVAHDYIVFEPNYRGSDNLGNAYQRAIYNDAGVGPGKDVMAGVAAVERHVKIDTKRIAVSGWSYGGYMTSWLIGNYHIWKAAISGAAVNDEVDEYALSDGNVTGAYNYKGSPFTGHMADYVAQSPLTYAANVTCPVLILSDVGDARVPITESYKMYHALIDNGKTAEFVAYPVSGHYPSDIVRGTDLYERWLAYLDRYLK